MYILKAMGPSLIRKNKMELQCPAIGNWVSYGTAQAWCITQCLKLHFLKLMTYNVFYVLLSKVGS